MIFWKGRCYPGPKNDWDLNSMGQAQRFPKVENKCDQTFRGKNGHIVLEKP